MGLLPKGVYRQRKGLADGSVRTYYRWRATGARIEGEPGTDEFLASLARVKSTRPALSAGTWATLVEEYRRSPDYRNLKANTQKYYDRRLEMVRDWGSRPVESIRRNDVLVIRDAIAITHGQAANQFVMVMSVILDFAVEREMREVNPLVRMKRIKGGTHATWNEAQIRYALTHFSEPYRRAVVLGIYTGQREGDCCAMKWSQYDGTAVAVVQEKTGASLWIPAHRALKKELDAWRAEQKSETILINSLGRGWPTHSFAQMISKVIH
jgi:integrase